MWDMLQSFYALFVVLQKISMEMHIFSCIYDSSVETQRYSSPQNKSHTDVGTIWRKNIASRNYKNKNAMPECLLFCGIIFFCETRFFLVLLNAFYFTFRFSLTRLKKISSKNEKRQREQWFKVKVVICVIYMNKSVFFGHIRKDFNFLRFSRANSTFVPSAFDEKKNKATLCIYILHDNGSFSSILVPRLKYIELHKLTDRKVSKWKWTLRQTN